MGWVGGVGQGHLGNRFACETLPKNTQYRVISYLISLNEVIYCVAHHGFLIDANLIHKVPQTQCMSLDEFNLASLAGPLVVACWRGDVSSSRS